MDDPDGGMEDVNVTLDNGRSLEDDEIVEMDDISGDKFAFPDEDGFFVFSDDPETTKMVDEEELTRKIRGLNVVVIGLFGRFSNQKSFLFDDLMQKSVWKFRFQKNQVRKSGTTTFIEGFHDEQNDRIYLQLHQGF